MYIQNLLLSFNADYDILFLKYILFCVKYGLLYDWHLPNTNKSAQ